MFYILIAVYIIAIIILLLIKEDINTKIFLILVVSGLLFVILPSTCDDTKIIKSIKIYSLYNNSEIEGNFVLGTGSINQEEYYYYFTEQDGAYYKEKISSNIGIIETDETPKLETTIIRPDIWYGEMIETIINQKLYVPRGTIIKEFKVR